VTGLTWIESNGGPLLVLPCSLLSAWRGTDDPSPGEKVEATFRWNPAGVATDYDRACDVSDFAGVIPVGSGEALVLADEPLPTTWLPAGDGGSLARWRFGPDQASVNALLGRGMLSGRDGSLLAAHHRLVLDSPASARPTRRRRRLERRS